jgi:glycerol-3-phosphate acyltransferase PlsY
VNFEIFLFGISIISAYLIGSIIPAILISKLHGKEDIRNVGSKSAGATNVTRALGKRLGAMVFLFDLLKGFIAILTAYFIYRPAVLYSGLAVIIGHIFPIFFAFKGGKGVATSLGILIFIDWQAALISLIVFIIIVLLTRYISLGSMIGIATFAVSEILLNRTTETIGFAMVLSLIIIAKHKNNILRLLNGTENRFSLNKSKEHVHE